MPSDLIFREDAKAYCEITGKETRMNQKQEKRRRLNARINHIEVFALWLMQEPPMWRVVSWHLWKRRRPRFKEG